MPSLAINGADLVYEDLGRGERAFVLVHGFTGFRDDFREHLPALAELGRTIVYDHRGHGDSTNTGDPATYSFDRVEVEMSGGPEVVRLVERGGRAFQVVESAEVGGPGEVVDFVVLEVAAVGGTVGEEEERREEEEEDEAAPVGHEALS